MFTLLYKKEFLGEKAWRDIDRIDKLVLSGLLVNGENDLVQELFVQQLKGINEDQLAINEGYVENTMKNEKIQLSQSLKDLGNEKG
jgi:hypothetical protein